MNDYVAIGFGFILLFMFLLFVLIMIRSKLYRENLELKQDNKRLKKILDDSLIRENQLRDLLDGYTLIKNEERSDEL